MTVEHNASEPLARRQRRRLLGRQPRCAFSSARDGRLDVLTLEYLAELTMAILSHLRSRDQNAGYVTDFPELLERLAPILREQSGCAIVTNAGGLNPRVVLGPLRRDTRSGGHGARFRSAWSRRRRARSSARDGSSRASTSLISRPASRSRASLTGWSRQTFTSGPGRSPRHSRGGARIVLTGRVADASLTLGPAVAAIRLALGRLGRAGGGLGRRAHLIECGAQATGGLWHRWDRAR